MKARTKIEEPYRMSRSWFPNSAIDKLQRVVPVEDEREVTRRTTGQVAASNQLAEAGTVQP